MAHHLDSSTAMFSPSIARIAASNARDWSYVDSWLISKFPSARSLPNFERNPETLKALLALASANEQADEERNLLAQAEASALRELEEFEADDASSKGMVTHRRLKEGLLTALENELPSEGQNALDAIASSAVALGVAQPNTEALCRRMISLQTSVYEMEQMETRVESLQRCLDAQLASNQAFLERLQSEKFRPSDKIPKENLDMQRHIKAASALIPELKERVAQLAPSAHGSHPSIDDIARQEEMYLKLLAQKKELDVQLAAFGGLPTDPGQARAELEGLRRQLRGITSQRDQVFEGLVEQASPVRRR